LFSKHSKVLAGGGKRAVSLDGGTSGFADIKGSCWRFPI